MDNNGYTPTDSERKIPLREKYLQQRSDGGHKAKTNNSGTSSKVKSIRPPRRSYGPF